MKAAALMKAYFIFNRIQRCCVQKWHSSIYFSCYTWDG